MTHGSLFSGIGGFDLAAQWMGWTNVFHCEINPFCRKVLHYHWPNSIQYDDIIQTDFSVHRGAIDILTGGFPCQPFSLAGKRKGKDDDRYLWKEMLRAVREIQPKWIVGENVFGIVNWSDGLVFEEVCSDLETEGYEVQSYLIPAASTGAPHQRMRCWFVANSRKFRLEFSTASRTMGERQEETCGERRESALQSTPTSKAWDAPDSSGPRQQAFNDKNCNLESANRRKAFSRDGFESIHTGTRWETFPSVSPICHGDDGLSDRLDGITFSKWRQESIKGYGNAVVPQLVYRIFDTIQQYENNDRK